MSLSQFLLDGVDEFARLGGLVVEEDPYVETTHDLEPFLSRMRLRGGVDVLVLAGEPVGGELVLRQMRRLGVHWPVIGGDGLTGIESRGAKALKEYLKDLAAEGYIFVFQDIRGRHKSEGQFVMSRPPRDPKNAFCLHYLKADDELPRNRV